MEPQHLPETSVIEEFNKIASLFEDSREDAIKASRGFKVSCTRLRKKMQLIKAQCQVVRNVSIAEVRRSKAKK